MLIKLIYGTQIHLYTGKSILKAIREHASKVFRKLPKDYSLTYIDEQGDQITVTAQQDLQCINSSIIRFNIQETYQELLSSTPSNQSEAEELSSDIPIISRISLELDCEEKLKQMAKNFMKEVSEKAIEKVLAEEQQIMKECVNDYIENLTIKTSEKVAEDSIKNVKKSKLNRSKSLNLIIQNDRKIKKPSQQIKTVQQMVEQKVNSLLPMIIETVTKTIQSRFMKMNCVKCEKSQLEVEKLINNQLMKKYRIPRESSINKQK